MEADPGLSLTLRTPEVPETGARGYGALQVAVRAWAAEQILARRLPEERPNDPAEYAAAARHEAQALRHRAHHKLMQAFLEPEIFEGAVTLRRASVVAPPQLRLVGDDESG